jgi:GNAT superfamily N-acetyltransferase
VEIRTAAIEDLDAVVDIALMVDPPADDAELDVGYYRHLLDHGRLVVAEASEIVIGYAAAIEVGPSLHVSDLFLHQDARGQGVGRKLLDALWDVDAESLPRQTFSSLHPAALPLYVRAGMTPMWPLLYLTGSSITLPASRLAVQEVDGEAAAEHEARWLGWDRRTEYGYWSNRSGARVFAVFDGQSPVAVGCTVHNRTMYTLGRLACLDASLLPDALSAAARWCGDDMMVAVPGVNSAVPMLVDAGWSIVEHDLYCASEPGLVDPALLLPHPGLL